MIKHSLLSIVILSVCQVTYADQAADFNTYLNYAHSQRGAIDRAKAAYAPQSLPGFSNHPKEAGYYSGDSATDTDLSTKAQAQEAHSDVYQANRKGLLNGPKFNIDKNSADIKRLTTIESDADNISRGISDKYIDCKKGMRMCHREVLRQSCTESIARDFTCHKNLTVQITYTKVSECNHLTGPSDDPSIAKGPANGQCIAGFVKYVGDGGNVNINTDAQKPFMVPAGLKATMVIHAQHDGGAYIDDAGSINGKQLAAIPGNHSFNETRQAHFTTVGKQTVFTFHIHGSRSDGGGYFRGFGFVQYPYVGDPGKLIPTQTLKWVDDCAGFKDLLTNTAICRVTSPQKCTKGKASTWINGKEVTKPCWQYTTGFTCGKADHGCSGEANCDQIGSHCLNSIAGVCLRYRQDYSCGKKVCDQRGMICGGQFFCMDGQCDSSQSTQNKDFGKDAAKVAAAMKAAEDVKNAQSDLHIFTGQSLSCRKVVLNTINCCDDAGWAKGLKLANCNDEEKKLHANKEHHLTVDVGDYCAKHLGPVCLEHKEAYCSFDGKLARIIQKQGRHDQLGISFGDGEHPDCRGITADELSRMNFDAMDFSDVINDMKTQVKLPDSSGVKDRIERDIHNQTGGQGANDLTGKLTGPLLNALLKQMKERP